MAVKMRLKRMGKKRHPIYRIVVADSRAPKNQILLHNTLKNFKYYNHGINYSLFIKSLYISLFDTPLSFAAAFIASFLSFPIFM